MGHPILFVFIMSVATLAGWVVGGVHSQRITRTECVEKVKIAITVTMNKCKRENVPKLMLKDCQAELNDCWDLNRETPLEDIEEMVKEATEIKDGMRR